MECGVSSVSLDKEMTRLIEYQQSYAATARVIDTVQQMLDILLAFILHGPTTNACHVPQPGPATQPV